ncbi:hypothetical protein PAAG_12522 [Paracoccidioides lutzii Pb01]|uniref:Uncharacterized protein n=1 Tax=Paracoccidioides lutzii (strain ATCC MYA-826 / Pb01) TaxID=502779 RepID=A0A0A2VIP8_PARBA|nr:hypothetical protein PAAG_12522 [Paracoccidioides lutzii Pb01]KGQ00794.1 hypothetical protein PAAG_12522 [Paracoccidioides lutzii Pb01]
MPMGKYEDRILDHSIPPVIKDIKGKSVIMAGGASGLGRSFVEAFTKAGPRGNNDFHTAKVVSFDAMYGFGRSRFACLKMAIMNSPSRTCGIVIANAGKAEHDGLFGDDGEDKFAFTLEFRPHQMLPHIMRVELYIRQLAPAREGRLILIGSLGGFFDLPGSATYSMSKFGARGLMHSLRRNTWVGFYSTYPEELIAFFTSKGVKFTSVDDTCKAALRITAYQRVNGRSLAVVLQEDCADEYLNLAQDVFPESSMLDDWQDVTINIGS